MDLPLLKDIHLPEPVGSFPLGYGVFVLACAFLVLIASYPLFRFFYAKTKKYRALVALEELNVSTVENVAKISVLLKRVCLVKNKNAAVLFGRAWLDFLDAHTDIKMNKSQEKLLMSAPYMLKTQTLSQNDFDAIKQYARSFLEKNL